MAIDPAAPPPRPRTKFARTTLRRMLPWLVIVAIFVFWGGGGPPFQYRRIHPAGALGGVCVGLAMALANFDNAWQTLMTTTVGFGIAVIVGLLAGIALGSSTLIYDGFYPARLVADPGLEAPDDAR